MFAFQKEGFTRKERLGAHNKRFFDTLYSFAEGVMEDIHQQVVGSNLG
jgi:hypothetical protein